MNLDLADRLRKRLEDGNPVKIKVGIDENGYISIESLQNDGTWVVHVRTSYPIQDGAEFRLGINGLLD